MKFGNWVITENTIEWAEAPQRYIIEKDQLLETVTAENTEDELYKWIIEATTEEWLNEDDLYDLNFAFVYAAGASQQKLDYEIFDNTLEYQFDILEDDDDDDDE
jgi:hypothetical protein